MTRSKTSKRGRRQHRGVVDWVRKNCHPAFRDGLLPYQKSLKAALETGTVTVHMSSKFARSYEKTMALLADYQDEHDGTYPPSLYDILGEPEPVDIMADIETGLLQIREHRYGSGTNALGAEERWKASQKDNPYAAPRSEVSIRPTGKFIAGDDAGHSLPGWGGKP